MIVNNNYVFSNDLLPSHVCNDIVKRGLAQKEQDGEVFNGVDKKVRSSRITWLNDIWIYDWITPLVYDVNKQAGWNFNILYPELIQFTKYKEKQFYGWHQDTFAEGVQSQRKISVVIPLVDSSEYEGGDLEFYNPKTHPNTKTEDKIIKDEKTRDKGRIILFPSFVFHQVTPVLKGERVSIVIWYNGELWK